MERIGYYEMVEILESLAGSQGTEMYTANKGIATALINMYMSVVNFTAEKAVKTMERFLVTGNIVW